MSTLIAKPDLVKLDIFEAIKVKVSFKFGPNRRIWLEGVDCIECLGEG